MDAAIETTEIQSDRLAVVAEPSVPKLELCSIKKSFRTLSHWKPVLKGVSLEVPATRSLGILGRNGAGKTTLIDIMCGLGQPDSGEVRYNGLRISWPIGRGAFQGSLTGVNNLRFLSRIYGYSFDEVFAFVDDFSELGEYMYMPYKSYSAGMKSRFAFAASMALDCFDTYLVDEGFNAGDARFTERMNTLFEERRQNKNMICVSHNPSIIKRFCDFAGVLDAGHLTLYEDVDEALEIYKTL